MKFFVIFLIISFLISNFDNQKYNVYQYSVIQLKTETFKYNCKCYKSSFKKIILKDHVRIVTDSVDYTFNILKHNSNIEYFLSKSTLPYTMREISKNGDYFLVITPFVFSKKHLVGGDVIAISNKKICE